VNLYNRLNPYMSKTSERRTLSDYIRNRTFNAQLQELSEFTARLSVILDSNDADVLHLKYRSER
jgi:hypothetical protein